MAAKQRQRTHRSATPDQPPGRAPRENSDPERVRDVAQRPKKYFVAKRLQESEMMPAALTAPPRRRRRTIAAGRAPVTRPDVRAKERYGCRRLHHRRCGDLARCGPTEAGLRRGANVGMLPVVDEGRLRGLITDRAVVVRAVAEGVPPGIMPVRECLTEDLVAAGLEHRSRDGDDGGRERVVGVVTFSSLVLRGRDQEEALEAAKEVSRRSARRAPDA